MNNNQVHVYRSHGHNHHLNIKSQEFPRNYSNKHHWQNQKNNFQFGDVNSSKHKNGTEESTLDHPQNSSNMNTQSGNNLMLMSQDNIPLLQNQQQRRLLKLYQPRTVKQVSAIKSKFDKGQVAPQLSNPFSNQNSQLDATKGEDEKHVAKYSSEVKRKSHERNAHHKQVVSQIVSQRISIDENSESQRLNMRNYGTKEPKGSEGKNYHGSQLTYIDSTIDRPNLG